MFINEYPYVDNHQLNLDFLLKQVAELDKKLGEELEKTIHDYLIEHGVKMVADYDATAERLTLKIEEES